METCKLVMLCLVVCIFAGCGSKPSKSESIQLGYQYLESMVPGIKKSEINVLKTYMKDESPVVVIQAGDMICEMPVLKRQGWLDFTWNQL